MIKLSILFFTAIFLEVNVANAQETLQSVMDRGSTTSNDISFSIDGRALRINPGGWLSTWLIGKGYDLNLGDYTKIGVAGGPDYSNKGIWIYGGTGNVGIGTNNPIESLELGAGFLKSGHISFGHDIISGKGPKNYSTVGIDNHASFFLGSNLYISDDAVLKIAKNHSTLSGAGILIPGNGQENQGSIIFNTAVPANVIAETPYHSPRMIINGTGNVGIGTTTPDEKLTVKGKIHAEEVRVDLNVPGPDYVFEQDYQLKSLPEIQAFIKENKHLPEIPSAKEMEEKGINLSEMNMLLLKKVEELTLHLIKQNEEIKELKDEIKAIKTKL
ncbi:tail fiber protein [Pedobacter glucosidilyticus]|uniref:tail fiber protein n=1 Tax=Pedobacter glucosidilyticus TaxID=1122941 RepID=UPI0026EA70CB|nr:tail fiber protein [Pedobacter glucosidilyticus]